jgi:hypothetical protein
MASLPIVADIPTREPALGFPEYVEALADAIRGGEPPQFTIGLYGAWGSGKSSLLNGIDQRLSVPDSGVIAVFFDAWRYERADHIVVPLLHAIATAVEEAGDQKVGKHLRRALGALLYSLSFSVAGLALSGKGMKEGWDSGTALDEAFAKPFAELRQIPAALEGRRIAVLIDDLDRCSPAKIVGVIEAINLVMDVPGLIFVLALDYDVLIDAVRTQYPHVSGHRFIEKIVQLPFRVPPLSLDSDDFLDQLIPASLSPWRKDLPPGFAHDLLEIARLALRSNPRQVKRLINSFILTKRIVDVRGIEIDDRLLGAAIGLQLGWPAEYEELQEAVRSGHTDPLSVLRTSEDEALVRYGNSFFEEGIGAAALTQVAQLTAVVAAEEPSDDQARVSQERVSETREERLAGFLAAVQERGFDQSPRSERLYYNSRLPDYRLALSDSRFVVRIEHRDTVGYWRLLKSFLVTRETDVAIRHVDELLRGARG